MSTATADKIRELVGEDFFLHINAKEFKTKGNDLQFRISSKNKMKSNMIKVQQYGTDEYQIKFFTYQPFKHIFDCLGEVRSSGADLRKNLKETLAL